MTRNVRLVLFGLWLVLQGGLAASAVGQATGLYWFDQTRHNVWRMNLDGSQAEILFAREDAGDASPEGVRDFIYNPLDQNLYWSKWQQIYRANPRTHEVTPLFPSPPFQDPSDLEVTATHIYWTEDRLGQIRRSDLDGSNIEILFEGLGRYIDFDIDEQGGYLYWIHNLSGSLHRLSLDGQHLETLLTSEDGLVGPASLHVVPSMNALFWVDWQSYTLHRAELDGSNPMLLLEDVGYVDVDGMVVDTTNGVLYFAEWTRSRIQRLHLDTGIREDVVSWRSDSPFRFDDPFGLGLDLQEQKIYWLDVDAHVIGRANVDGSEIEAVVSDHLYGIRAFDFDAKNRAFYWHSDNGAIRKHELDTETETILLQQPLIVPTNIHLDYANQQLIWTDEWRRIVAQGDVNGQKTTIHPLPEGYQDLRFNRLSTGWHPVRQTIIMVAINEVIHFTDNGTQVYPRTRPNPVADVAVDWRTDKLYWVEANNLVRADLDGSNEELLRTDLSHPRSLVIDIEAGHLYWALASANQIVRSNLNGENVEIFPVDGYVRDLALEISPSVAASTESPLPPTFARLHPNYPNPFHDQTTLTYEIAHPTAVELQVYDILGREQWQHSIPQEQPGTHTIRLQTADWPPGVYVYRLTAGTVTHERQMVHLR